MFSRRHRGRLIIFLIGVLTLSGTVFFWWRQISRPVLSGDPVIFVVSRGESLERVARRLEDEGLIRNAFAFKFWMLARQKSTQIQAGSFRIMPGLDFDQLANQLATGFLDVWVTFPEGWRTEQYALRLREQGFEIDFEVWQQLTEDLEGYLYPDTYLIPRGADEAWIVSLLAKTFDQKTAGIDKSGLARSGLSWSEAVVVASLVEREVSREADLPLVAGVIIGRWQENWALQIDATVQYVLASRRCSSNWVGCDWWPTDLTKEDLQIDSPFNTYQQPTLPPQPICNPGLETIEATVNYSESDYRYYLSDSEGVTHFAISLSEHNENVFRYLRN